jgi:AraC-like DNA-binding protein
VHHGKDDHDSFASILARFKKATGINLIDYLSRVRLEKSKTLLLNPNSRISEAAIGQA